MHLNFEHLITLISLCTALYGRDLCRYKRRLKLDLAHKARNVGIVVAEYAFRLTSLFIDHLISRSGDNL